MAVFFILKRCFSKSPNNFSNILATLVTKFVAKNLQISPNLVALPPLSVMVMAAIKSTIIPLLMSQFFSLELKWFFAYTWNRCHKQILDLCRNQCD